MHGALAVLVITERLQRQWQQRRSLFGKHGRDLTFGGAVNARISPPLFPVIQVGLSLFEGLEAQAFQRCFLGMGDATFHFSLAVSHQLQVVPVSA